MASGNLAALEKFIALARQGLFDVRHYMAAGYGLMAVVLVLISQTSLQARVIDPDADFARTAAISGQPETAQPNTMNSPVFPKIFKLSLLEQKITKDTPNLTRMASLGATAPITEYSPKDRTSCSLEAARAAARGDTSKISPCITALLSGDEDALVDLPEKMSAFFIETMNSDAPPEEMGKIMINSMMKMMEALSNGVKSSDETPEKTATVN